MSDPGEEYFVGYGGEYVTVSTESSKVVICHGKNVVEVYEETERVGYKDPVVIWVPASGERLIYSERYAYV